ncbi:hypothetical protein V1509DRAFT_632515 [Lipomyces kononenkoae]
MASQGQFMRFASPNEQRTISREDLGFYHAVIVGAVYELGDAVDVQSPNSFFYPLQRCVEEHPYLSVTVCDTHADKSFYQRVPNINLEEHITIADSPTVGDNLTGIEEVIASNLDKPFHRDIPLWRVVVLPLQGRCFIAFAFSHAIGDGLIGPAFHRTFLNACRSPSEPPRSATALIKTPIRPLPAPFDTPERLPISWKFLLAPLFVLILPSFIAKVLGVRASASPADATTWTASAAAFDLKTHHTKLVVREIEAPLLEKALRVVRIHDATLTGLFHQIIARALSKAIPSPNFTNFVSITAINMRRSIGVSNDEMGDFVSGCYLVHPRTDPSPQFTGENWAAASSASHRLSETASTLQDQAIGLLRYLPSIRKWMLGKLGKKRDSSYEVSNIGSFDAQGVSSTDGEVQAKITKIVFAQPGHVDSSPLAFNLASTKGDSLMYTVTWPAGALGFEEADEKQFVDGICSSIRKDLEALE